MGVMVQTASPAAATTTPALSTTASEMRNCKFKIHRVQQQIAIVFLGRESNGESFGV